MKKLLLLFLLIPALSGAQPIDEWDVVREGYFKVVVGIDTLQDDFDRYDTAVKFAYDYAKNAAQGAPINIISPGYRFEYSYAEQEVVTTRDTIFTEGMPDHPYLSDVRWTYRKDTTDTTGTWSLKVYGNSRADELSFRSKCVGRDTVEFESAEIALLSESFEFTQSYSCDEIVTWDLTARTDTLEISPRKYYLDIALVKSLE